MSLPPDELTALLCRSILQADDAPRVFHRRWHRNQADGALPLACAYCQAPLDIRNPGQVWIDYLVPLQLGGPAVDENRVFSCPSCARSKSHKDLVSWRPFHRLGDETARLALLAQRRQVLAIARNHLPSTRANAPLAAVLRELEKRWEHPRFTVYAVHGKHRAYIGWTKRNGADSALGLAAALLRFGCKAVQLSTGNVVLYELDPTTFLDAVWFLIDHHALVQNVPIPSLETVALDPKNWQHTWPQHFEHLSDLRRRRRRLTANNALTPGTRANAKMRFFRHGILPSPAHLVEPEAPTAAPHKPRQPSTAQAAVAKRERYQRLAKKARTEAYLTARASLDTFKESVRQGRATVPSAQDMDAMEREVLALLR